MGLFQELLGSIYFNYLTFGTILAFIFTLALGIFLLYLPNRSKATTHLGYAFLFMGLFNLSYAYAAMLYHPYAAFHRWGTVGFVLPAILHFAQWIFYFPEESHHKIRKTFLYTQYAIACITTIIFIKVSLSSSTKFHFTGHYWDFDAEDASKYVGVVIFLFVIVIGSAGFWKTYVTKTHERWAILEVTIALLLASLIPSILNVVSRDGLIEREAYLLSLISFTVLGFFFVIIIFINRTNDRTTFMAKIVGITLVTFLLMMQVLGFISMRERETEYDTLRLENMDKYFLGGDSFRHRDILYAIEYSEETKELKKDYYNNSYELDFPLIEQDFINTIIYEEIANLPEDKYKSDLQTYLTGTPIEFEGYKNSILEYMNTLNEHSNREIKEKVTGFFGKINKITFTHVNKISNISHNEKFCSNLTKHLESSKDIIHFKNAIFKKFSDCKWENKEIPQEELRRNVFKYIRYFKASNTRHYRKGSEGKQHFVAYIKYYPKEKKAREVGYSYIGYRLYMHPSAKSQIIILFIVLLVLLIIFPFFFKGSLINPLNSLLRAVRKVNAGDLNVKVTVKVHDEIGFLASSFNSMVESISQARKELQDYAENLEEKVKERTREVQEKMEEVQKLKVQQDGDYFLTSLLAKPLFYNANKSEYVKTDFFIHQKKTFEFRNKKADLGGDICVTGNLKFGKPTKFQRYTMAMNADAMGKSMQGAGGSLVMGVVMNSIMARSASNKRIMDTSPEEWLTNVFNEVNAVFKTFNGTMVISATIAIINDESGEMIYFNAEHPFSILYRDEKASFLEDSLKLRKLGIDSEFEFEVRRFQLLPGDIVILGSDGRDDIDLTPEEPIRTINEDENAILGIVEKSKGNIFEIEKLLHDKGAITDDLSFLRIGYKENLLQEDPTIPNPVFEEKSMSSSIDINQMYLQSKKLYQDGETGKAIDILMEAYAIEQNNIKLNRLLGLLSYKGKSYDIAAKALASYLEQDPNNEELCYYLSISLKKLGNHLQSLEAAKKAYNMNPSNVNNLINLSDLHRLMGNFNESREFSNKALAIEPENKNAKKILMVIGANV